MEKPDLEDQEHLGLSTVFQTTAELLERLRVTDDPLVREEFVERFHPAIFGFARRLGWGFDASEDLGRTILETFRTRHMCDEDAGRSLGETLLTLMIDEVKIAHEGRRELPGATQLMTLWEQEWRDAMVRRSLETVLEEVGEATFEIYRLGVLENWNTERIMRKLDLTHSAVVGTTRRLMARIRELRQAMEEGT